MPITDLASDSEGTVREKALTREMCELPPLVVDLNMPKAKEGESVAILSALKKWNRPFLQLDLVRQHVASKIESRMKARPGFDLTPITCFHICCSQGNSLVSIIFRQVAP